MKPTSSTVDSFPCVGSIRACSVVILFMLIGKLLPAQPPDLRFDHYGVEEGLSQSTVWNMFEDSHGFIWFTTPDGINKFDGYSFTSFRHIEGDSNSLFNNNVVFLFEDSTGDLWVSHVGGLSKYHYKQNRFEVVDLLPEIQSEVDYIIPAGEKDGVIWCWNIRGKITGYNRESLKITHSFSLEPSLQLTQANYSRYAKAVNDKIFIGAFSIGLIVFDLNELS